MSINQAFVLMRFPNKRAARTVAALACFLVLSQILGLESVLAQMPPADPHVEQAEPAAPPKPLVLKVRVTAGTDGLGFIAIPGHFQAVRAIATKRLQTFVRPYMPVFAIFSGYVPGMVAVSDTDPSVDFVDLVNLLFVDTPEYIHIIIAQEQEWKDAIATSLLEDKESRVVIVHFALSNKPPQLNPGPYVIIFRNDSAFAAIVQLIQNVIAAAAQELGKTLGDLSETELVDGEIDVHELVESQSFFGTEQTHGLEAWENLNLQRTPEVGNVSE